MLNTVFRSMARAIIADDHPIFRAAIKQALGETLESEVLEASSFTQLESLLKQNPQLEFGLVSLYTYRKMVKTN